MFTEIQPKSKDSALNRNCWFLMILAKFYRKLIPNAKFGPVRPKELCVFFLCVSPSFFCYFVFTHRLIYIFAYIPHIYYKIPVSKIQHFQLLIGHIPPDTPYAMRASVQLTLTLHQIPPPPHCRRRVYIYRAALCSFGVLAVVNFLVDELWKQSESLNAMLFSFFFSYT